MKVDYTIDEENKTIELKSSENGYDVVFSGFETIKPLFDYVIIEKDEEKKTTNGGLVIPDSIKEKPSTGTVVAIGSGNICEETGVISPMFVNVGDRIIFLKNTGMTVTVNGKEITMLKQSNILGIME